MVSEDKLIPGAEWLEQVVRCLLQTLLALFPRIRSFSFLLPILTHLRILFKHFRSKEYVVTEVSAHKRTKDTGFDKMMR